jgi:hypothetical protein
MDEEDFGALGRAAVEEEAGGGFGHGVLLHPLSNFGRWIP